MTTRCPTPTKSRYATVTAADQAAHRTGLTIGLPLRPYECACTWWHLTKSAAPEHATTQATPAAIQYLATLPDIDFREIVALEARGQGEAIHNAALRDAALLRRWRKNLGQLMGDVDQQLADRRHERSLAGHDWRKRAVTYRNTLTLRTSECRRLLAELQEYMARTKQSRLVDAQIAAAAGTTASELRRHAGEVAIERLINAHGGEFSGYLAEALKELGLNVPDRVKRHLPAA